MFKCLVLFPHNLMIRLKCQEILFYESSFFNVSDQHQPVTQCRVCVNLMCRDVYILYVIKKNPIFFSTDMATVKVYLDI